MELGEVGVARRERPGALQIGDAWGGVDGGTDDVGYAVDGERVAFAAPQCVAHPFGQVSLLREGQQFDAVFQPRGGAFVDLPRDWDGADLVALAAQAALRRCAE